MKKLFSSLLIIILLVTCVAVAYAENDSSTNIFSIGSINVTQHEYNLAKKTSEFYNNYSVDTSHKSINYKRTNGDPILDNLVSRKMIEALFIEKQIVLTEEEHYYVDNYSKNINATLDDMLKSGNDDEKNNALEIIQLKDSERKYCNLTQTEYNIRETAEVEYSIKFKKLVNSFFNGNSEELISFLQNNVTN